MVRRNARQVSGNADSALAHGHRGSKPRLVTEPADPDAEVVKLITGDGHSFTVTKATGYVEARCTCGVVLHAERPKYLDEPMRRHLTHPDRPL